jgi:ABC-type nickel/cobalt efflux system permease component RcnA
MNQGQATIEYLALVLVGLVAACLLVRTATPVEQLALAVVHAIVPVRHRAPPVSHKPKQHHARHATKRPCSCISGSTWPETGRLTRQLLPAPRRSGGFTE